jgi:hypothetical protein
MPIPALQNCGACKFMDFAGPYNFYGQEVTVGQVQVGYCRARPPWPRQHSPWPASSSPGPRHQYLLQEWPEVLATDWCGDWQQDEAQVQPYPPSS